MPNVFLHIRVPYFILPIVHVKEFTSKYLKAIFAKLFLTTNTYWLCYAGILRRQLNSSTYITNFI